MNVTGIYKHGRGHLSCIHEMLMDEFILLNHGCKQLTWLQAFGDLSEAI